jgi:glycolate oxidase FAD binding subunit
MQHNLSEASARLTDRVAAALADRTPLRIRGGGSKDFYVPSSPGEVLDTSELRGVVSYEPSELVVTVGAGTPLAELEALLAEKGQCLPFEPPHFGWSATQGEPTATVGGMVAAGLAGPARASVGGVRDYVLGVKLVNGLAQHLTFGGQVMKNVAGYDVSRLMVGALGTLGLLTEVSLKVLPQAPAEATLVFEADQHTALEQLHRWGAEPLPLNASCWVRDASDAGHAGKDLLFVRLRGAVAAVESASQRMMTDLAGTRMDNAQAQADWTLCGNQRLPFFARPAEPNMALWRMSVPQTAAVLETPFPQLVEWHGGLRWLWAPMDAQTQLQRVVRDAGGSAAVFVAPHAGTTGASHRFDAQSLALAAVERRLKDTFDPHGIFNPGLSPHANHASA